MIEDILASGLQRLSISFDGASAAEYEKNRVNASFEQVTENIRTFLEQRRQAGRKTPRLAIEMMRSSPAAGLEKNQKEFLRRFKDLGLDELVLKQAHNWAGHLRGSEPLEVFSACTFPWNALVVFFDGTVAPCAQDFFGLLPPGKRLRKYPAEHLERTAHAGTAPGICRRQNSRNQALQRLRPHPPPHRGRHSSRIPEADAFQTHALNPSLAASGLNLQFPGDICYNVMVP